MEESKGGEAAEHAPRISSSVAAKAEGGSNVPEFFLCAALEGHKGDVRSLAVGAHHLYSGARDNAVMAWELDEKGHIGGIYRSPSAETPLPDWVNALTVRLGASEVVVGGCKDGGIYVMEWKGGIQASGEEKRLVVEKTLLGHDAPISSLSWSTEGLLLSGSWDETARGWDLELGTCQWVLRGHENNVCVLGLGPGAVATGSTGLEVEGHLVGQQIRIWEGSPPKECRSLTDHKSGIRDLCLMESTATGGEGPVAASAFCSASNDGTVRAWGAAGDCRAIFTIPDQSFVFSVCSLGDGLAASGDDAGNLSAFRLPPGSAPPTTHDASVLYKHPNTVWSVAAMPGTSGAIPGAQPPPTLSPTVADVATGSADRMVRVFTADPERALQGDRLKEAESILGSGSHPCSTEPGLGGGLPGERLPLVSEMGVMVGGEDGQLSAFADEATGGAKVFRWAQAVERAGGTWEPLGTLQPPVRKVAFEGGLYDKVIPVEVESASRGFLFFQLGVNLGDDPKSVAAAFCNKHALGPEYVPQIEQFLFMASS